MLAAGGIWLRQHDAAVRADVKAEILSGAVDSLKDELSSRDSLLILRDSIVMKQKSVIEQQQEDLARQELQTNQATMAAVARVRGQLTEELKPLFDSVTTGYERQIAIKNEQLLAEHKLTLLYYAQLETRDSVISSLRRLNESITAKLEIAERQTHKSLTKQIVDALPIVAAGVIIGTRLR